MIVKVAANEVNVVDVDERVVRENRAAWLAALRSGSYRQARMALRRNDAYCCLGVAEDVVDCEWLSTNAVTGTTHIATRPRFDVKPDDVKPDDDVTDHSMTALTRGGARLLGLVATTPSVVAWSEYTASWVVTTLVNLNDTAKFTLAEIADVIEDQGDAWDGSWDYAHQLLEHRIDAGEESGDRPGIKFYPPSS